MKRKVLAMSLLRLGDIILSVPVLRGLREHRPNDEIHILINKQFEGLGQLIPYVDKVHLFDRGLLQDGLGRADLSLFEPYERLGLLIEDLNNEKYDQIINLTHSRLSGYLMQAINASERLGLCLSPDGQAAFASPWFRYLNSQVEVDGDEVFHYTDVFRFALGVDAPTRSPLLIETESGRRECEDIIGGERRKFIVVQPFTSDAKKDWGLSSFAEMLKLFTSIRPDYGIYVVCAPSEEERVQPMMADLASRRVSAKLAVCSLAGAFSLLRRAELLITGDTAIKHLACAARTPLVELSLGSSDYHRTGAYLQNSVIIQTRELCAPCVHSRPCHREVHFCAARVRPEAVAMVAAEVLTGDLHQLRVIAEEYIEEIDILRVETETSGFWLAWSVLEPFTEPAIARVLGLWSQKIHLEEERLTRTGELNQIGSETGRLERFLRKIHPGVSTEEWRYLLDAMEDQMTQVTGRLSGFEIGLRDLYASHENPRNLRVFVHGLIAFRDKLKTYPTLRSWSGLLDPLIEDDITPAFTRIRRIGDALYELRARSEIEIKLIRTLMNQMEVSA